MRTDTPQTIHLKDYKPSAYLIDHVSLDFHLDPEKTVVFARLDIRANPAVPQTGEPLVLDGDNIMLINLSITGEQLAGDQYQATDSKLIIFKVPEEPFTLEMETTCAPEANTALSGLYRSGGNYCTQCEAQGFRRITYFLDRPDILSKYRVRMQADKKHNPVLLANGNKVLEGTIQEGDQHFAIWEDPFPKPSYLFALVAGDLACYADSFTTSSGRTVRLEIYVEHGKQNRCEWAMQSLKRSMKWDEEVFGREYDLDIFMIVAVSDFNMGAMENKGLNIFNDKYILARPETATDADFEHIESIIAHEYFHNWSGNRVTCRDWFQLCLKEGLTVFRDQEFSSDVRSRPVKRVGDVKALRAHQFPEDAGPLAHPVRPDSYIEINNFYTATVYEKGAEVVRMIRTLIGEQDFRRAMDLYFARHDGEAATVEDFVACMAEVSGRNFDQFFRWYTQAGTPDVVAQANYDPIAETFALKLIQSCNATPGQAEKLPFHIPLRLGLIGPDGNDLVLDAQDGPVAHGNVLELTEREQSYVFANIPVRPVMSLNRGFSAPVNLTSNVTEAEKLFLMARDSDHFNRFEACQELAERLIIDAVKNANNDGQDSRGFVEALAHIVEDTSLEPAFVAQMLSLPADTTIAGKIAHDVDPEAIHAAREGLAASIGTALKDKLLDIFNAPLASDYSPDAGPMGQRAVRLAALHLIAAGDADSGAALAYAQFERAAHMSDEYDALVALARIDRPQRLSALDGFFERHKDDHLLVDKWFGLHALAPFPETLGQVRTLMDHELFSLKKPNTVRALIGTFSMANPVAFNSIDGAGYEFFADVIVALDKLNPQVAARLTGALRNWRLLEHYRRDLARQALERINQSKDLSRDCLEITQKSLA